MSIEQMYYKKSNKPAEKKKYKAFAMSPFVIAEKSAHSLSQIFLCAIVLNVYPDSLRDKISSLGNR